MFGECLSVLGYGRLDAHRRYLFVLKLWRWRSIAWLLVLGRASCCIVTSGARTRECQAKFISFFRIHSSGDSISGLLYEDGAFQPDHLQGAPLSSDTLPVSFGEDI